MVMCTSRGSFNNRIHSIANRLFVTADMEDRRWNSRWGTNLRRSSPLPSQSHEGVICYLLREVRVRISRSLSNEQTGVESRTPLTVKNSAQVKLLRHDLNTGIGCDDDLGGHVNEETMIDNTGHSLELAIHSGRIVNSALNGQIEDVVAVVSDVTTNEMQRII